MNIEKEIEELESILKKIVFEAREKIKELTRWP